eukprot:CAMPEP_0201695364 /NCGR_PEP_ID=MMETSP0578-20130828/7348_1 /ASSEMBLY_ACC=CAM_ASM_000663 /TAXON_ID=267565 /ORGANISM="Skeletonema grethea, Strain CCMP 1804" /LENGTH=727 /DNA_ID=CAMNT_0048181207 /DNA_START=78 /DNA_END=2261 /DNA_ORIENTATION=-
MGCSQSKAVEVPPGAPPQSPTSGTKNLAKRSSGRASPFMGGKSSKKIKPSALYHHLLHGLGSSDLPNAVGKVQAQTVHFWIEAQRLCETNASTVASYVDLNTKGTPLHVACSLGSARVDSMEVADAAINCVRTIMEHSPGSISLRDNHDHVPLEGIFSAMAAAKASSSNTEEDAAAIKSAYAFRMEVAKLLLTKNPTCTLLRGEKLYCIAESLSDDCEQPLGPTAEFVKLLVDKGGASAQPSVRGERRSPEDDDDVLAMLYRRFVRQFDQSERFFEGDNSRPEVVSHREKFKNAAVNTFNIIELLLRQPKSTGAGETDGDLDCLLVHNAVRSETCAPDLLRYIVETNLEKVAEKDSRGNLPLHYAAGYGESAATDEDGAPVASPEAYSKYVIDELLYAYPIGASVENADGTLPITLAIESSKKWIGGGIRSLHEAYPEGIEQINLGDKHPLMHSMSFATMGDVSVDETSNDVDGNDDEEGTIATGVDGGGGRTRKRKAKRKINKDESHDAIMFVQKPDAPVRDVITTMWANEDDGGVQMLGCTAIANAAKKAGDSQEAVASVALLGVTTAVNAMKNHPNEPVVQEKACAALTAMAPADGMREVSFAASGAIATTVCAMQAHVSDATVQREACRALSGIAAKGGADRATTVASVSGFTALVNALGAHPDDMEVQKEACLCMEVLTSFPDAYLPQLDEQTDAYLQAAAEKFPEVCSEPAKAIRSRLNGE